METCEESSRDIIAIVEIKLIEKMKAYGKLRYQTQAGNITTVIGISPVFLGNKKTHHGTIDATAVLLHRHDQVQPARRPSLVALPISVAVAVATVASCSSSLIFSTLSGNADRSWQHG